MIKFKVVFFYILLLVLPAFSFGSDFQSPRTAGLGGAGHATPFLNDAIYLNPSFISFHPYRGLSFNYLNHFSNPQDPTGQNTFEGNSYNFSILDGSTDSLFQAGIGLTKRGDGSIVHIGASKSITSQLGFGLGTKIIFPVNTADRIFDASFAFSAIATQWFQASLIIDNLVEARPDLGLFREFILGTKLNLMSLVAIYVDPHWVPTITTVPIFGYEGGLEFTVLSDLFLRFGTFTNSFAPFALTRGNGYSLGTGFLAPKLSVDYAFTQLSSPMTGFAHQFGMTIFF